MTLRKILGSHTVSDLQSSKQVPMESEPAQKYGWLHSVRWAEIWWHVGQQCVTLREPTASASAEQVDLFMKSSEELRVYGSDPDVSG